MKASEIKVGEAYQAKVAGRTQDVRIERKLPRGGWEAIGLGTNKRVRIKTPQQLLGPSAGEATEATPPAPEPAVQMEAGQTAQATPTPAPKGKASKRAAKPKADTEPAGEKKLSCLDAAAQVLKGKGEPMQCKAMIDAMAAADLWHSDAPTPSATLYSAILREITTKGTASRFRKTDRGHFALNA